MLAGSQIQLTLPPSRAYHLHQEKRKMEIVGNNMIFP